MDFLDQKPFASVNRAKYSNFILPAGLSNTLNNIGISSGSGTPVISVYDQELLTNYPFSNICAEQSITVANLRVKLDSLYQQQLTSRSQALSDQITATEGYLKRAVSHMNTVACSVAPDVIVTTTTTINPKDTVLGTTPVAIDNKIIAPGTPVVLPATQSKSIIPGVDNKILKIAAAGIVVLAIFKVIK